MGATSSAAIRPVCVQASARSKLRTNYLRFHLSTGPARRDRSSEQETLTVEDADTIRPSECGSEVAKGAERCYAGPFDDTIITREHYRWQYARVSSTIQMSATYSQRPIIMRVYDQRGQCVYCVNAAMPFPGQNQMPHTGTMGVQLRDRWGRAGKTKGRISAITRRHAVFIPFRTAPSCTVKGYLLCHRAVRASY